MKIFLIILFISSLAQAQVAIGKETADGAGILDFASGDNRGIMLPRITDASGISTAGTLYYDAETKKVMCAGHTEEDLSVLEGEFDETANGYDLLTEEGDGVVVGDDTTAPVGVLVLEDDAKALILPKVASPHLNIENPEPGLICYDTDSKMLAVYDGVQWTFWGQ